MAIALGGRVGPHGRDLPLLGQTSELTVFLLRDLAARGLGFVKPALQNQRGPAAERGSHAEQIPSCGHPFCVKNGPFSHVTVKSNTKFLQVERF